MANIGFIGLGNMGLPMAINLVKAGHNVIGFDLQSAPMFGLQQQGGKRALHIDEVVEGQEVLITMLQTAQQVKAVCLSNQGLYSKGHSFLHIDCSTIDVETSRQLNKTALQNTISYIDAPVSGGVNGAKAASLTFMVGGLECALERARPLLLAMGTKIFHTGAVGNGQAAKICNNMILGISMIAACEAFTLAEQLGLPAEKLFEVVNNASGQCWAISNYVPVANILENVPANNNFKPGFTALMMQKDLLLSQQAAANHGLSTPLGELATALYQQFNNQGFGELDFSAIIKTMKKL